MADAQPQQQQQQQGGQQQQAGPRTPLCPDGTVIRSRWRVVHQIGMGAFGEIYLAKSLVGDELVAIKVEVVDEKKQALRAEVAIFRKLQGCPYVCQFISCGRQDNINFLVMELMGENLSDIRKRQPPPNSSFSVCTTARLVYEMVRCLEQVHALGVLHRDVKPSNFVLGKRSDQTRRLFIIDFGLSRKFVDQTGVIKPPRANAGFRGTARYASINSHQNKELSPRDDLWSVLYVAVEFATGTLPWRQVRDRDKVGEMKALFMNRRLVDSLPPEFEDFMNHLHTLGYESRPNYSYVANMFKKLCEREGGSMTGPFEWEHHAATAASLATSAHGKAASTSAVPAGGATAAVLAGASAAHERSPQSPAIDYVTGNALARKMLKTSHHNAPVGSAMPSVTAMGVPLEEDAMGSTAAAVASSRPAGQGGHGGSEGDLRSEGAAPGSSWHPVNTNGNNNTTNNVDGAGGDMLPPVLKNKPAKQHNRCHCVLL